MVGNHLRNIMGQDNHEKLRKLIVQKGGILPYNIPTEQFYFPQMIPSQTKVVELFAISMGFSGGPPAIK